MKSPRKRNFAVLKNAAFTLVESVLALGIVAVTIIPMMGMVPVGLNTHRNTIDRATSVRITQQISGEILNGSSPLTPQPLRYFDSLAQETYDANAPETIYFVNVVPAAATPLPGDADTIRKLTLVTVEVCYNPSHRSLTLDTNNHIVKREGQQIREYTFNVSTM